MKRALFTGLSRGPDHIRPAEYFDRRLKLIQSLWSYDKQPFVFLQGSSKTFSAPDVPHNFRQCSHFRYLTGCLEPGSYLALNGARSTLFVDVKDEHQKLWEGEGKSFEELKQQGNLDEVLPLTELATFLANELTPNVLLAAEVRQQTNPYVQQLIDTFPGARANLFAAIDQCRWIKSGAEIEHLKHAAKIGSEALNSVVQKATSISNESVFVGLLEYEMRLRGADCIAYPPVVAGGDNANTIHYLDANQTIDRGNCVLIDAGADYRGYCSDITRCFPISGRFSSPQLELYCALNHIHEKCLQYVQTVRPLKLNELFFFMLDKMSDTLMSIAFFKQVISKDEALHACEKLCEHHISHYLGLDIHDTSTISRTIAIPPNVVITVEPGIYVKKDNQLIRSEFRGVGFRIEDDVLITETGAEILTSQCAREANNIETLMS